MSTVTLVVSTTEGKIAGDLSSFSVSAKASFFLFFRYLNFYSQTINSPKKCAEENVKKMPKKYNKIIKWNKINICIK